MRLRENARLQLLESRVVSTQAALEKKVPSAEEGVQGTEEPQVDERLQQLREKLRGERKSWSAVTVHNKQMHG